MESPAHRYRQVNLWLLFTTWVVKVRSLARAAGCETSTPRQSMFFVGECKNFQYLARLSHARGLTSSTPRILRNPHWALPLSPLVLTLPDYSPIECCLLMIDLSAFLRLRFVQSRWLDWLRQWLLGLQILNSSWHFHSNRIHISPPLRVLLLCRYSFPEVFRVWILRAVAQSTRVFNSLHPWSCTKVRRRCTRVYRKGWRPTHRSWPIGWQLVNCYF